MQLFFHKGRKQKFVTRPTKIIDLILKPVASGLSCHVSNSSRDRRYFPRFKSSLGITISIVRNWKQFLAAFSKLIPKCWFAQSAGLAPYKASEIHVFRSGFERGMFFMFIIFASKSCKNIQKGETVDFDQ